MKNFKKWLALSIAITILSSCVKDDDLLITYEGKVFTYVGPYISQLGVNVNESDLYPAVGVTMRIYKPGPHGFLGHPGPEIMLDEQAITDADGNYSFIIRSNLDSGYYSRAEFPENIEYTSSRGSKEEFENRVVFVDIILVDNQ